MTAQSISPLFTRHRVFRTLIALICAFFLAVGLLPHPHEMGHDESTSHQTCALCAALVGLAHAIPPEPPPLPAPLGLKELPGQFGYHHLPALRVPDSSARSPPGAPNA